MVRSILYSLLVISPILAEPALILSESSLAGRIHAQNPDLKAARWKIEEAVGKWQQSGRPSRPKLDVQWEHDAQFREGQIKVGVSRSFPLTNRLAWEKEIGQATLEAAEMEVRRVEQEIIAEARLLFVKALAVKSRRQWMAIDQKEANEFAELIKQSQQRAEASPLDAGQARLDAATLLIEQKQLDAEEVILLAELKKLLGMRLADNITVGGELPPLHAAAAGKIETRADYQQALREVDRARSTVGRELASRYDDLEAGVYVSGMSHEDAPDGFREEVMLGFQFSIPLPFGDDNSGNIAAAKAGVQRREQEAKAILANARHDAQGANAEMVEWKKLDQQITTELMPLAEQQLKLSQQAYTQGQGELPNIFRARAQKRQLALAQIDARSAYHQARIRNESSLAAKP
jgi:cobalt-zinc-cadmium efflux system outer membrane protein